MKRFFYLVVLMALSSSAQAGNSFSFVVAGHRITIEAPGDCNSPSCVSVSIPGIYPSRGERDRYDENDEASDAAAPANTVNSGTRNNAVRCRGIKRPIQ